MRSAGARSLESPLPLSRRRIRTEPAASATIGGAVLAQLESLSVSCTPVERHPVLGEEATPTLTSLARPQPAGPRALAVVRSGPRQFAFRPAPGSPSRAEAKELEKSQNPGVVEVGVHRGRQGWCSLTHVEPARGQILQSSQRSATDSLSARFPRRMADFLSKISIVARARPVSSTAQRNSAPILRMGEGCAVEGHHRSARRLGRGR